MQIQHLNLTTLKPYKNNPRNNKPAIDAVANSIKEFGFKNPIIIDSDYVIVCGHTRYQAAKKLKLETVPCIIADDLTEEQIKAFRLADNKTAELAEWDIDLLNLELGDLLDFDMEQFGFSSDDIEEFTEDDVNVKSNEPDFEKKKTECTCPHCGLKFVPIME